MPEDLKRYEDALGEPFPVLSWLTDDDDLLRTVIDEAIERGEPWEEGDLLERQGLEPPPTGAVL